jgi:signal transduction histidine kinase/ActR/RegA family two-component response regulator
MFRLPRFRKLHIFFSGPFVLIGLVSILVVSIIAVQSARKLLQRMTQDLVEESLYGVSLRVEQMTEYPTYVLDDLAGTLRVSGMMPDTRSAWIALLNQRLSRHESLQRLTLGFPQGGLIRLRRTEDGRRLVEQTVGQTGGRLQAFEWVNGRLLPGQSRKAGGNVDVRRQLWFQQALSQQKTITAPLKNQPDSAAPYSLIRPVYDQQGVLRFVLRIDNSFPVITPYLREIANHPDAEAFVVDQTGRLLGSSLSVDGQQQQAGSGAGRNAFNHPSCLIRCSLRQAQDLFGGLASLRDSRVFLAPGETGDIHVAMRRLPIAGGPDVVTFAVIPETAYLGYIRDVIKDVFWVALTIIAFLPLTGYLVSLHVTSPILQLNRSLRKVGQGQWDSAVVLKRNDEIGELSQSVYQMAQRLKDLVRNLESLVEERTADLKELLAKYAQANQELERTNATKDRFFSIIAHDLKSPFTALKGYSGIIEDSFDSLSKEQLRSMVNRISVSSEEAHGLLENLLQWALIQSGRIRVKWDVFDIREVMIEALDLAKVNAKVKNISLENEIHEAGWVEADRNMVATVLRNLISNSIKFTKAEHGRIKISGYREAEYFVIAIEDNGVGISDENLKKLFAKDIYFSQKGTGNERGTGLGLGLCKEFVVMNRGQIEVTSQVGEGTCFKTFWLAANSPQIPEPQKDPERPFEILCVDDSEDNHNLINIFLKNQPWNIEFVQDGEQALQRLETKSYDVILMDLNMPGIGGIETTRQIRAYEKAHNQRSAYIIAFTSSVLQVDIDAAINAGCDSYLLKPVKKQKLIHAISRISRR